MESVLRVNRLFLTSADWKRVAAVVLCLLAKGKAAALLSEVSRRRLSSFKAPGNEFAKAVVSYVAAVLLLSPMDVLFNELVARLRMFWSHRLTMAIASKMVKQKLRNEDDDKNFETLVASEADRFVELQIDLSVEAMEALTHMYFFTQILWGLSPSLGSAGIATAVFGTSMSLILGKSRLPSLFREERKATGTFAHNLSRCRENLESIQFAGGMDLELSRINELDEIRQKATNNRKREKDLIALFSSTLRRLAGGVLPSVILHREREEKHSTDSKANNHSHHGHSHDHHAHSHLTPNRTHGVLVGKLDGANHGDESISELAQASEAFDEILYHLLIVSENFHSLTRLMTLGSDICNLMDPSKDKQKPKPACDSHISFLKNVKEGDEWIQVSDLSVQVPKSNVLLLDKLSISLKYGDTLLITGPSGSGKTALLRVLFGLWPASGKVARPDDTVLMALPQRPFCSSGTLAELVTYPKPASKFTDDQIKEALITVGLQHIVDRYPLTSVEKWQEQLSMGEQQRIGFSRIVLHKPEFAFFDESSSSLDLASEAKMYELMTEVVKGGFVSVGHRKSIEKFHLSKVHLLGPQASGQWKREF